MTIQTCIAGRNLPVPHLLRTILQGRGHEVSEAENPARCFLDSRSGQFAWDACKIIVAEYAGAETVDMIDFSIERTRVPMQNIAVFANNSKKELREMQDIGCKVLLWPFRAADFVEWVAATERRCGR